MNHLRILSLALLLAGLAACQPKTATNATVADTSPPIATVANSQPRSTKGLLRLLHQERHRQDRLPT